MTTWKIKTIIGKTLETLTEQKYDDNWGKTKNIKTFEKNKHILIDSKISERKIENLEKKKI